MDGPAPKTIDFASHRKFVAGVAAVFGAIWVVLAIRPVSREDWLLENIVVAIGLIVLAASWRWYVFSRFSYVLFAVFLVFHTIGAHYTYSEVPYRNWFGGVFGIFESAERNQYDRLVHFLYGFLLMYPFREAFLHIARVRWPFWGYLLPFSFVLATSLVYELLEWIAAEVLGGEVGMAFVGSQGDIWDAQKDSMCALVGAFLALVSIAIVHLVRRRDAALDWVEGQNGGATR